MNVTELLSELARLSIRLEACGNRLRYHPRSALTPDLADRLKAHKADILASMRPGNAAIRATTLDATYPQATFDWDASRGYCPGRPVARDRIHHKREACRSCRFWEHIWGERYCSDCWPCTDPLAMIIETPESTPNNTGH